jgi:hypothetical protein
LIVLRRKLRGRVQFANSDRWFFVQLYRWFPSILQVLTIIRPETLKSWLGEIEQWDKWSFCLTAAMIAAKQERL